MQVAVIDDLVPLKYCTELNIIKSIVVNSEYECVENDGQYRATSNHAINVCAIINKYSPNAEIVNISINDENNYRGDVFKLVAALEYCYRESIKLINMSIGSQNLADNYLIDNMIFKMFNNKQIIVTAKNNIYPISFPSVHPYVIAVSAKEKSLNVVNSLNQNREVLSESVHKINLESGYSYETEVCNSYAAPFLTSQILNGLANKHMEKEEVFNLFQNSKITKIESPTALFTKCLFTENDIGQNKIIKFPINKGLIKDYIYIDDEDEDNIIIFENFIEKIKTERCRVFYIGNINPTIFDIIDKTKDKCKFFILPRDEVYSIDEIDKCIVDNKIIVVGNRINSFILINQLLELFYKNRINAFGYSSDPISVFFGMYYFDNTDSNIRKNQLLENFQPDVEIEYQKKIKESTNSIIIEVEGKSNTIIVNIKKNKYEKSIELHDEGEYLVLYDLITSL